MELQCGADGWLIIVMGTRFFLVSLVDTNILLPSPALVPTHIVIREMSMAIRQQMSFAFKTVL